MSEIRTEDLDVYVQQLTASQGKLRGYILASLGDYANAADVLQQTNLTLWRKAPEFRSGEEFLPWALGIARYQILSFLRDHERDRLVFSENVARMMLDVAVEEMTDLGDRQLALRKCLEKVPPRSLELLRQRYEKGSSIRQIARDSQRSEDAIKSLFLRIRRSLEGCIETTLRLGTA